MIYDGFASLYDELMNDFDYEAWFNYIEDIFKKHEKDPKSILEMACGTGSLSYFIAQNGYKLTCFDLSNEMLAIANEKLRTFKNTRLMNQNMIDFKYNEKFDAILSICDSINYVIDSDDLLCVFKNVFSHLKDDGIFIFDINSHYKLKNIIGNNTFVEDRGDIFYTWQNQYEECKDICNFYLTFFIEGDDETYERIDETHREKAYTIKEVTEMLELAGFTTIRAYEGFTHNEVGPQTERVNFVVMK